MTHVLDDAIGSALRGNQAHLAVHDSASASASGSGSGSAPAARFRPSVAPFASVGLAPSAESWSALRAIAGDESAAMFVVPGFAVPDDWERLATLTLTQLTDDDVDPHAVEAQRRTRALTRADVPEMLRLTAETQPGPFLDDTIEFGGYRGVFDGDALVALAGRRLNPTGWVEVSAVCTDPRYRGRGYARELVLDVVRGIREGGERAFLHVATGNPARGLYEAIGFVPRRDFEVAVIRARSTP